MDDHDRLKEEHTKTMNAAVRLLTHRSHTKYEIRQKLRQRGFRPETITDVISECERLHYVNDEETAQFFIRELTGKGYGPRRIRFSLRKKGIDSELIDKLLLQCDSEADELDAARRAFHKKRKRFEREKDFRKKREKIYRYLCSRGFSGSVISELIQAEIKSA